MNSPACRTGQNRGPGSSPLTNLPKTYVLPDAGDGTSTETRAYDLDQRITEIVRADGRTLTFAYDPDEQQLTSITSPLGATTFSYQEPTDQLESIVEPLGEELSFTWDTPLLTSATWTGTVNGSVEWTYDTSFRPQTVSVNGANPGGYSYDQDSLVTGAGALSVTREADTGRESTTTLGNVTTTRTYTPFGEPDTFVAQYNGSTIYAEDLDYDDRGWITDIERTPERRHVRLEFRLRPPRTAGDGGDRWHAGVDLRLRRQLQPDQL